MKKLLLVLFVAGCSYLLTPMPEARAMEPVTIALLTPVAIQVAREAAPYVAVGLKHLFAGFVDMGKVTLDIFRFPVGFFQATFFSPWYFYDGLKNLIQGSVALPKLIFHAVLLPIRPFGAIF